MEEETLLNEIEEGKKTIKALSPYIKKEVSSLPREMDVEQVRKDIIFMALKLKEATQGIKEVYERILEIYDDINYKEVKQEASKY